MVLGLKSLKDYKIGTEQKKKGTFLRGLKAEREKDEAYITKECALYQRRSCSRKSQQESTLGLDDEF